MNIREGDRNMPYGMPHRRKGPGRFERESVSLVELIKMFPTERAARLWLDKSIWSNGPVCPYCETAGRAMLKPNGSRTHRCSDRSHNKWFSVKTGFVMKASHLSCKRWVIGMYLFLLQLGQALFVSPAPRSRHDPEKRVVSRPSPALGQPERHRGAFRRPQGYCVGG